MSSNHQEFPQINPHPLRLSIGPSPWAFVDRSIIVAGVEYRFDQFKQADGKTKGLTILQNSNNEVLLIFNFYNYLHILEDGTTLLWREDGNIKFDCFHLSSLQQITNPLETAINLRENKLGVSPIPTSQHWEISPRLDEGTRFPIDAPNDWARFEETLVLANYADANGYDKMARAIYVFDWHKQQVEVFPQHWFNNGNYDFGYQWITRVTRQSNGKIIGDGIRLGSFELDDTNCQIKKWISENPFHMIK
jgi:hypothetical protein